MEVLRLQNETTRLREYSDQLVERLLRKNDIPPAGSAILPTKPEDVEKLLMHEDIFGDVEEEPELVDTRKGAYDDFSS
jgi:hypothetical protein